MAGLHADDFGWYAEARLDRLYTIETENGTISIGAVGRNGGSGIRFSGSVGDAISLLLDGSSAVKAVATSATAISEIDVRISAAPTSMALIQRILSSGEAQASLFVTTCMALAVYRGTTAALMGGAASAVAFTANRYTRIGWKVFLDDTSGTVSVTAMGAGDTSPQSLLSLTTDTMATTGASWDQLLLGAGTSGNTDYCNWVVKDGATTANNDLRGANQNVVAVRPDGNGNSAQWSRSGGLLQWTGVDDPQSDDDATYNASTSTGLKDTLSMEDTPQPDDAISFVALGIVCKGNGNGERIAHVLRHSGNDTESTDAAVESSYAPLVRPYDTAQGTAWTPTVWSAVEAGYTRTA